MGAPLKPCDDLKLAKRRMQYRNVRRRKMGLPIETAPVLVEGTPRPPRPPRPAPRTFDDLIDRSTGANGCWMWLGNRDDGGYGRFGRNGKVERAHRIALEDKLGRPIRKGFGALHRCDNSSCVNPAHLYEGTPADNLRDVFERGRWPKRSAA